MQHLLKKRAKRMKKWIDDNEEEELLFIHISHDAIA